MGLLEPRVYPSALFRAIRDDGGSVVGVSKIARDISDRKRAEAEAQRAQRRD